LERFTGKGVGRILLDRTFQLINESGFSAVWLTVYHKNERAINFYKSYGFTDIGNTFFVMQGNQYENRILMNHFFKTDGQSLNG